jgi:brefeldin A-resistance guanine nucleotide exchange factor 1
LKEHGLIDEEADPDEKGTVLALAKFLRKQPRLDKKLLGEYLSHPDNLDLLKAFIGLFDFRGVGSRCRIRGTRC